MVLAASNAPCSRPHPPPKKNTAACRRHLAQLLQLMQEGKLHVEVGVSTSPRVLPGWWGRVGEGAQGVLQLCAAFTAGGEAPCGGGWSVSKSLYVLRRRRRRGWGGAMDLQLWTASYGSVKRQAASCV